MELDGTGGRMDKDAAYLKKRKALIRELITIEAERKAINARWRAAVASAKALDRYLISDEEAP